MSQASHSCVDVSKMKAISITILTCEAGHAATSEKAIFYTSYNQNVAILAFVDKQGADLSVEHSWQLYPATQRHSGSSH